MNALVRQALRDPARTALSSRSSFAFAAAAAAADVVDDVRSRAEPRASGSVPALTAAAVLAAAAAAAAAGRGRREEFRSPPRHRFAGARHWVLCEEGARAPAPEVAAIADEFVESQRHLLLPSEHNPTPTTVPPPIEGLSGHHLRHRIMTCVIGLPLRGQSHIAQRLRHYLSFFHGANTELFDVNDYLGPTGDEDLLEALRRFFDGDQEVGSAGSADEGGGAPKHAVLFTRNALEAAKSNWSGHSKSRRRWMKNALEAELGAHLCIVEIQVNETLEHRLLYMEKHHLTQEYAAMGAMERLHQHLEAFEKRFVTIQDDGSEDDISWIKVCDYNKKVITNNMMHSFLGSRVARFLGNVHPYNHTVYLLRCGESEYTGAGKIGGDSPLAQKGHDFAQRLAEFADIVVCKEAQRFACVTLEPAEVPKLQRRLTTVMLPDGVDRHGKRSFVAPIGEWDSMAGYGDAGAVKPGMRLYRIRPEGAEEFQDAPNDVAGVLKVAEKGKSVTLIFADADLEPNDAVYARLWTSALQRAKQTVAHIRHPIVRVSDGKVWEQLGHREYRNLNEQYAGEYEGLTYDDIAQRQPQEADLRNKDKLGYRYPRGESYYDVIARLDDMIHQLESYQEPVMIVAHLPVLRLLYAYVTGMPRDSAPDISIPSHAVIRVHWEGTSALSEHRYTLGPPPSTLSSYPAGRQP